MFKNRYLSITLEGVEFDLSKAGQGPTSRLVSVIRPTPGSSSLTLDKSRVQSLSSALAEIVPDGFSISVEDIMVASYGTTEVLSASFGASIDLSALPFLKGFLPGEAQLAIKSFQLMVSTGALTQSQCTSINEILPPGVSPLPLLIKKGVNCTATLQIGTSTDVLSSSGTVNDMQPPTAASTSTSTTKKNPNRVGKKIGPIEISDISLGLKDGKVDVDVSGSLSLGPLKIGLIGFTATSTLDPFSLDHLGLHGLSLNIKKPPLSIDGLFEEQSVKYPVVDSTGHKSLASVDGYGGMLCVKYSKASLTIEGSYAHLPNGITTVVVFGFLRIPAGGPPLLRVTDIAAGFGYNRAMTLPEPSNVQNYVLVKPVIHPSTPPSTDELNEQFMPVDGGFWGTIGIRAESFKMVSNFVLLVVQMEQELEIDIIGLSDMSFPVPKKTDEPTPALAKLKVGLVARFIPERGVLAINGVFLPGSYIYVPQAHITGGYAVLVVFKDQLAGQWNGAREGDFVVTMGGYATTYAPKPYYPRVSRLEMNWNVSSLLSVKAQSYFAITPQALMAGGHMMANFQAGGDFSIHVYFAMGADFIIYWKPYHYTGQIYVDLSVSASINIDLWLFTIHTSVNFDLGADLEVWGPSFSGHASVHVHVLVSFTVGISFGESRAALEPIGWDEFNTGFLPAADKVISCTVSDGIIASKSTPTYHVVNAKELSVVCSTAVPVKAIISKMSIPYFVEVGANITMPTQSQTGGKWTSSDTKIATVDKTTGKVTGVATGDVKILYTLSDTTTGKQQITTFPFAVFSKDFGIQPMANTKEDFSTSNLTVTISKDGGPMTEEEITSHFQFTATIKNMPAALWQPTGALASPPQLGGNDLLEGLLSGVEISARPPEKSPDSITISSHEWDYLDMKPTPEGVSFPYTGYKRNVASTN